MIVKNLSNSGEKQVLKSKAKSIGVKSTFVLSNKKVIITSFGRGNAAIIEKLIDENSEDKKIIAINPKNAFDVNLLNKEPKVYEIKKGREETKITKPNIKEKVGSDLIGAKDKLEMKIFGRNYDDNVAIQIIYNILDISKIISIYINSAIATMNNLARSSGVEEVDYIGYSVRSNIDYYKMINQINNKNKIDKFTPYYEKSKSRLTYFDAVYKDKTDVNEKRVPIDPKYLHETLRVLSATRVFCFHGEEDNNNSLIFHLEEGLKEKDFPDDLKDVIHNIYANAVDSANEGFKESATNIKILFEVLGCKDNNEKKEVAQSFYNHIMKRDSKNQGFSYKKLREELLKNEIYKEINDKKFDHQKGFSRKTPENTVNSLSSEETNETLQVEEQVKTEGDNAFRGKLYTLLDYIIYWHLEKEKNTDPMIIDKLCNKLRSIRGTNKSAKEIIYNDFANKIAPKLKNYIYKLISFMGAEEFKKFKEMAEKDKNEIFGLAEEKIKYSNTTYFSKLIYFISRFLDGKEINEFYGALINKFDNISGIIGAINNKDFNYNEKLEFSNLYSLFKTPHKVAEELRITKNIASLKADPPAIHREKYIDAVLLLGLKNSDFNTEAYDKNVKDFVNNLLDPCRKDTNLRNFLVNNVIKSKKFLYIVKYCNPLTAKEFLKNTNIVEFTISRMDSNLKERYCQAIGISFDENTANSLLTKKIVDLSGEDFLDVKQNPKTNDEKLKKEQYSAILGLYLAVMYVIIKSLVKVNAFYVIAISRLEFDTKMIMGEIQKEPLEKNRRDVVIYSAILKDMLEKDNYLKKTKYRHIQQNLGEYSNTLFIEYRNKIAHLSVINLGHKYINGVEKIYSYFGLYHYIMQRILRDSREKIKNYEGSDVENNTINKCFNDLEKFNYFSKDLINILNLPFAYNIARYKNLSIEDLFNSQDEKYIPTEKGRKK